MKGNNIYHANMINTNIGYTICENRFKSKGFTLYHLWNINYIYQILVWWEQI